MIEVSGRRRIHRCARVDGVLDRDQLGVDGTVGFVGVLSLGVLLLALLAVLCACALGLYRLLRSSSSSSAGGSASTTERRSGISVGQLIAATFIRSQ